MLLTLDPNGFQRIYFFFKTTNIPLFPDAPYEKYQDKLPDSIEDVILKEILVQIFDGISNTVRASFCSFTYTGYVGQEMNFKWTFIGNVLHVFLVNFS